MDWKPRLASITGTVDQELLLRNEYLVTEHRLLRTQITGRGRLTDGERTSLAEIGKQRGKQALQGVAQIVKPKTMLGWPRKLVAQNLHARTIPATIPAFPLYACRVCALCSCGFLVCHTCKCLPCKGCRVYKAPVMLQTQPVEARAPARNTAQGSGATLTQSTKQSVRT